MAGVMSPLMASCVDVRGSPCWGLRCRVTRQGVNTVARLGLPQIIWVFRPDLWAPSFLCFWQKIALLNGNTSMWCFSGP